MKGNKPHCGVNLVSGLGSVHHARLANCCEAINMSTNKPHWLKW